MNAFIYFTIICIIKTFIGVKMRVLSIRQPYASRIIEGRKTIELRSWNTSFRGRFYIHASGKHPTLPTSAIVGTVELIDVVKYTSKSKFLMDRKKHLLNSWINSTNKKQFKYGFILKNPRAVKPILTKGRLGFWDFGK